MNKLLSSMPLRAACMLMLMSVASFAQSDPFSAMGASATTIATGTLVTGGVLIALVIGGLAWAIGGRVAAQAAIALILGSVIALSAPKWLPWLQSI